MEVVHPLFHSLMFSQEQDHYLLSMSLRLPAQRFKLLAQEAITLLSDLSDKQSPDKVQIAAATYLFMAEQQFRVNDATASDELKVGNSKLFLNNVWL